MGSKVDRKEIDAKWDKGAEEIAKELKREMVAYHKVGLRIQAQLALEKLIVHNQRTELAKWARNNPETK